MAKFFSVIIKLLTGVFISAALTLLLIMFTPSIFNKALGLWIETLPSFKYVSYQVTSKQELADRFGLETKDDDVALFSQLQDSLPDTKDKSSPFFRFLTVHAYPTPCSFTLIGIHRTIDVTWQIEGLRCKGKEACELAKTQQICPDKKKHDK
ncbi:hypothetical protein [Vibrio ziniensis]|uniref:Uncharacterized protein n=1 Tax=Vibrio ziniensis TaxID=2711221 RepID=A0A6G7CQF9_9VIBR|nr:hypothetical protein [Vibrio ziniensis]QIH44293.1 hypothetical protein G5S32_20305 [Vibrio ziniensis]